MTDSSASTGVSVPALYIGQPDYVLSVSDDLAEPFDITASRDGAPIITGCDFRPALSGLDPRDNPIELADVFGSFLGAAIERADFDSRHGSIGAPNWSGWTIHDTDADLSDLANACAQYGEDESSC